jgi:hypothetical protein
MESASSGAGVNSFLKNSRNLLILLISYFHQFSDCYRQIGQAKLSVKMFQRKNFDLLVFFGRKRRKSQTLGPVERTRDSKWTQTLAGFL